MAGDDALSPDDLKREYGWSRSSQVRAEEKGPSVCAESCTVCPGLGCTDAEVFTRSACTVRARALVPASGVTPTFVLCTGICALCTGAVCVPTRGTI
jgi:hypothetical protein